MNARGVRAYFVVARRVALEKQDAVALALQAQKAPPLLRGKGFMKKAQIRALPRKLEAEIDNLEGNLLFQLVYKRHTVLLVLSFLPKRFLPYHARPARATRAGKIGAELLAI
jgi:hypothetical protein